MLMQPGCCSYIGQRACFSERVEQAKIHFVLLLQVISFMLCAVWSDLPGVRIMIRIGAWWTLLSAAIILRARAQGHKQIGSRLQYATVFIRNIQLAGVWGSKYEHADS